MYFDFYYATIFYLIFICSLLVIGILLFKLYQKNNLKSHLLKAELARKKQIYALKIKAVERFALYLERLKIANLVTRIKPVSDSVEHYKLFLAATIEQELNYNSIQQLYISTTIYNQIVDVSQETIQLIKNLDTIEKNELSIAAYNKLLLKQNGTLNKRIDAILRSLKSTLTSY